MGADTSIIKKKTLKKSNGVRTKKEKYRLGRCPGQQGPCPQSSSRD